MWISHTKYFLSKNPRSSRGRFFPSSHCDDTCAVRSAMVGGWVGKRDRWDRWRLGSASADGSLGWCVVVRLEVEGAALDLLAVLAVGELLVEALVLGGHEGLSNPEREGFLSRGNIIGSIRFPESACSQSESEIGRSKSENAVTCTKVLRAAIQSSTSRALQKWRRHWSVEHEWQERESDMWRFCGKICVFSAIDHSDLDLPLSGRPVNHIWQVRIISGNHTSFEQNLFQRRANLLALYLKLQDISKIATGNQNAT